MTKVSTYRHRFKIISLLAVLILSVALFGLMTTDEVSADEVCEFTDIESGVEYLRSRMVERANVVSLTFRGDAASEVNYSELYTGATEHTGVPNEGDYIVKHFGGYSCSTTSGIDDVGQF